MRRLFIPLILAAVAGCGQKAPDAELMTLRCKSEDQTVSVLRIDPSKKIVGMDLQIMNGALLVKLSGEMSDGRTGQVFREVNVSLPNGQTPTGTDFNRSIKLENDFRDQMKKDQMKQHVSLSDSTIEVKAESSSGKNWDVNMIIDRTLGEMKMGDKKLVCTQEKKKF